MFAVQQNADGTAKILATGGGSNLKSVSVEFAPGVEVIVGRGTVDTDRTYIAMRNSSGVLYYIYVDTTTLVTTTVAP